MRHFINILLFLAGGVAVAFVTVSVRRDDYARAPTSPPLTDRRIDALVAQSSQIDALLVRLDRIEAETAALRDTAPAGGRVGDIDLAPKAVTDTDNSALDEAALKELKAEALRVAADSDERRAALEMLAKVAAHSKDPQLRAEAWLEQGTLYFHAKDYAHAADVLRRSVDEVGLTGDTGQTACFQLGWALCFSGNAADAYDASRRVMDTPGVSKPVYANARWASAVFAAAKGDAQTARPLYDGMIADYTNDPDEYYRRIATMSKQGLAQLR